MSRAPDAQTAAAYRRATGQRCWACNAPDSEPVRLERRVGERWVAPGETPPPPLMLLEGA